MRIRTHRLTLIILMQLALLCHTPGLLWAESRTWAIKHVSGRNAVISLGISYGVTVGLRGEIFREEMVEGQQITSKLAELTVTEAYPDSAVIEISMRFAPVRKGDQVRIDDVIVPQIIVPRKEELVPTDSPTAGQEKPSKKYRIGLGVGYIQPVGNFKSRVDWGVGFNFHTYRLISDKIVVGPHLSYLSFRSVDVPSLEVHITRIAFQVKYFRTRNSFSSYLFGGPSFDRHTIERINRDDPQADFIETDKRFGLFAGVGLDYLIGRSLSLGFESNLNLGFTTNEALVKPVVSYISAWLNIAYRF